MNYQVFKDCFKKLCLSFDLDFDKKKSRMEMYYESKLGQMREDLLLDLIKQAIETIEVKPGYLPSVRKLVDLYYTSATNRNKPRPLEDSENWQGAICPICNGTGRVTLWREGYSYGGYCCTCIIGQKKQHETTLGRELGCYTKWLKKGYTLEDESLPKEAPF